MAVNFWIISDCGNFMAHVYIYVSLIRENVLCKKSYHRRTIEITLLSITLLTTHREHNSSPYCSVCLCSSRGIKFVHVCTTWHTYFKTMCRMVGYFQGFKFLWHGKPRQFCGFIISQHAYFNHLVISLNFRNFSWIRRPHEIHKNLNPTKITNHTAFHLSLSG